MARHLSRPLRRVLGVVPALWRALRRRWRRSLQFSAVVVATSLSLLAFLFAGSFLSTQIASSLFRESQSQALEESSKGFSDVQGILNSSDASSQSEIQKLIQSSLTILETHGADAKRQWILVPEAGGQAGVGAQAQNGWMSPSSVPQELQEEVTGSDGVFWKSASMPVDEHGPSVPVLIVGSTVHLNQGDRFALYLVYDLSSSQQTLDYIQFVVTVGFAILLVFVATIVWWVTRSVIRPISQTAAAAERLADGDLDDRVVIRGENEAAILGASFNEMADSIQHQIEQLETLSKMQQRFVSDVSHELRTPLTTVKMAAELLYDGRERMEPSFQRSTELMYHQVDRFESLLADLLEISRFDAGSATLDVTTVDLADLVEDTVESVRPHLDRAGLAVRLHGEQLRCAVQMDPRRIERVLRNLLVNAIEHAEGRPLDIWLAAGSHDAAVAVRDHGVGMSPEQSQRVFDRFWRADPSRKRTLGGTGLGLSIAAEDVRLHGGRLEAWGEPGQGACFRLTLPLRQGETAGDSPLGLPPDGIPDPASSRPPSQPGATPTAPGSAGPSGEAAGAPGGAADDTGRTASGTEDRP